MKEVRVIFSHYLSRFSVVSNATNFFIHSYTSLFCKKKKKLLTCCCFFSITFRINNQRQFNNLINSNIRIGPYFDQTDNYAGKTCSQKFDFRVLFITLLKPFCTYMGVCACDNTPESESKLNRTIKIVLWKAVNNES